MTDDINVYNYPALQESLRLRNQLLKKGLVQGLAPVEESESHARLLDIQTL